MGFLKIGKSPSNTGFSKPNWSNNPLGWGTLTLGNPPHEDRHVSHLHGWISGWGPSRSYQNQWLSPGWGHLTPVHQSSSLQLSSYLELQGWADATGNDRNDRKGRKTAEFSQMERAFFSSCRFQVRLFSENGLRRNSNGIVIINFPLAMGYTVIPHFQTHWILRKVAAGFCCSQQLFFHAAGILGSSHRSRWA